MPTMLFLPSANLAWIAPLAADPAQMEDLALRIKAGEWRLPADWHAWLRRHFALPEILTLTAHVQGRLLVVMPDPPLPEKRPGATLALYLPQALTPNQHGVLMLLARGMTVAETARQMEHSERWVKYQIRAVRIARAALLREERKKAR